jgi:hypothetical protein
MDEQTQYQPAAKPKSELVKIIMINVVVSILVSVIASYAVVSILASRSGGLEKRVVVLEQKVDKILSKISIK